MTVGGIRTGQKPLARNELRVSAIPEGALSLVSRTQPHVELAIEVGPGLRRGTQFF